MEDPNAEQTPLGTLQKGSIDILGAKVNNEPCSGNVHAYHLADSEACHTGLCYQWLQCFHFILQVTIVPNPERVPALNGMDWLIRIENAATGAKFEVSD